MSKFEYSVEHVEAHEIYRELDAYGRDGWKLRSALNDGCRVLLIMERERSDDGEDV